MFGCDICDKIPEMGKRGKGKSKVNLKQKLGLTRGMHQIRMEVTRTVYFSSTQRDSGRLRTSMELKEKDMLMRITL